MKTIIFYESFFGNTQLIAEAIGKSLEKNHKVQVLNVKEINWNDIAKSELLIVGSAIRGFMPCPDTKLFLKSIPPNCLKGLKVAAFDTRISLPAIESKALRLLVKTGGYAAKHIAKALIKKGGNLVIHEEGFLVKGEKGPLVEGEQERAAKWAEQIVK